MSISEAVYPSSATPLVNAQQAMLDAIARESFAGAVVSSRRAPAASQAATQGRQAAQLDNRGASLTPSDEMPGGKSLSPALRRRKAWALRDIAARLLRGPDGRGPAVCGCGRSGHDVTEVGLHLRDDGSARACGIHRCDSAWLCADCAPRRGKERQERMAEVFDHVKAFRDGQMVMCTLTIRHKRGQSLLELRKAVQAASRTARQGAPWARRKKQHQVFGVISAPEVTYSDVHGWHFHIHTALLLRGSGEEAQDLGEWFVRRYLATLKDDGYEALVDGQDVSVIWSERKLAEYIAKGVARSRDIAWEMAGQATKRTRKGQSLHPFEILERASGDPSMATLWLEYAEAMKGVRSCVVTKGIADALGIEPAADDDNPGVELDEPDAGAVGTLPSIVWNECMRKLQASTVLAVLEDGGAAAWPEARALAFDVAGFIYDEVMDGPPPPAQREIVHAPTPEHLATLAKARRHEFRRAGDAVRAAYDRERGVAVSLARRFEPPPVKRVLELMAA